MSEHEGWRPPMSNPETAGVGITWDSKEDIAAREGHIRDNEIYLTAGLVSDMQQTWGVRFEYVKTRTDVEKSEVWVFWATKDDPDAIPVRRVGTTNTAIFSFLVPLKKMGTEIPDNRQLNVTPTTRQVPGVGTVYVFSLTNAVSVPRNRREEAEAVGTQPPGDGMEEALDTGAEAAPGQEPEEAIEG